MAWNQPPPGQNPYFGGGQPPAGYGAPQGGYGAPPAGYGAPQGGYGAPQGGYGAPQGGYGAPQGGYGAPQGGYGAPPGGYGAPPGGYGAPPGVQPDVWQWFQAVDADRSGKINCNELRQALLNGNMSPFNEETCRLMIGMFDRDRSGTIDINEFQSLWKYIQEWKRTFDTYDRDRSGRIEAHELATALNQFGYRLSPSFCALCVRVFDRSSSNSMKFDDFIQCCVLIHTLTAAFKHKDNNQNGVIDINYEQFLEMVIENTIR